MQIQRTTPFTPSQNNAPNFQARLIAKAVTTDTGREISLYSLGLQDRKFFQKMLDKLDLEKLYGQKYLKSSANIFNEMLTIVNAQVGIKRVLLATENNSPCGVISFFSHLNSQDKVYLSRIITWPTKPNSKVPHAGKTLIRAMFDCMDLKNISEINLIPMGVPMFGKSCLDFYKLLGFKPKNKDFLKIDTADIPRRCAQLENYFSFKPIDDPNEVDLKKTLNLTFDDSIFSKASQRVKVFIQNNFGNLGRKAANG